MTFGKLKYKGTERGEKMAKEARSVRFDDNEIREIEQFLSNNRIFDFSTLVRAAVMHLIRQDSLPLVPVQSSSKIEQRSYHDA